jgi:hypothetical protein
LKIPQQLVVRNTYIIITHDDDEDYDGIKNIASLAVKHTFMKK